MNNFTFYNPTKLIFGKGSLDRLPTHLPKGSKVLLTYGGGSIIRNGIYDKVMTSLAGYDVVPFGGIQSNPDVSTVEEAIKIGRDQEVSFVLAVGGGSVIDATKLIAAGISSKAKPWDIILSGKYDSMLPYGTVLTVPATGSEMNRASVISNRSTKEKFSFYSEHPQFSILDPTFTYTLSNHQVACGIADAFMHTMEQYMTYPDQSGVMDRMAEGILLNLISLAKERPENPNDYDLACEYMLSATIALNGFLGMGVTQDWVTHKIGHEITALTGATHGASLAMVYPSVLYILKEHKRGKLLQYGERIWGITEDNTTTAIEKIIHQTAEFFRSLGLAASMKEASISHEIADEIAHRFKTRGQAFGEHEIATPEVIGMILNDSIQYER